MSIQYLRDAVSADDREKLYRYVKLHFGDGNERKGQAEVEKSWTEALKQLIESPPTDQAFIHETLKNCDDATLAHLFFHLHFHFCQRSGEWIHDGSL